MNETLNGSPADPTEAMRMYARQAKNRTLEVDAAVIRMRAERRLCGGADTGQHAPVTRYGASGWHPSSAAGATFTFLPE